MIYHIGEKVGNSLDKLSCDVGADVIELYWAQIGGIQGRDIGDMDGGVMMISFINDQYWEQEGECESEV